MQVWSNRKAWLESEPKSEHDVCVGVIFVVDGKSEQYFVSLENRAIAEAAEFAVGCLAEARGIFVKEATAQVWWRDGAVFGPFRVRLTVVATAYGLRGKGSNK